MKILISESSNKMILTESVLNDIKDKLMSAKEVAIMAIKSTAKQLNMDLKFLLTWGASIGGLMGPLSDYINGNYPEIDEASVYSLIVGAVSIVFYNNEIQIRKVIEDIKEKGLSDVFSDVLEKTKELKNTLSDFISSVGITVGQVGNIISYAFLIPIIPMLISLSTNSDADTSLIVNKLVKSLLSSGGVALSANLLKVILIKIVERIKQTQSPSPLIVL
jgi:hypothetical protein